MGHQFGESGKNRLTETCLRLIEHEEGRGTRAAKHGGEANELQGAIRKLMRGEITREVVRLPQEAKPVTASHL